MIWRMLLSNDLPSSTSLQYHISNTVFFHSYTSSTKILYNEKANNFFSKLHICETKDLTFLKAATIPYPKYIFWFKRPIYFFFLDLKRRTCQSVIYKKYQTELLTLRRYCKQIQIHYCMWNGFLEIDVTS